MRWRVAQFLELRWWKKYLHQKPVDDYLQWKTKYWNQFLKTSCSKLNLQQAQDILDAGCGPAGIFTVLDQHKVTAIDPLLDHYQKEIPHFKPEHYSWVEFQCKTLEAISFRETFDTVFCLNVINHVEDIQKSIESLVAACKTGGTLVISVDAHRMTWAKFLARLFPVDILHPHQYDLDEYCALLRKHKLKIQSHQCLKQTFWFNYEVIIATKA